MRNVPRKLWNQAIDNGAVLAAIILSIFLSVGAVAYGVVLTNRLAREATLCVLEQLAEHRAASALHHETSGIHQGIDVDFPNPDVPREDTLQGGCHKFLGDAFELPHIPPSTNSSTPTTTTAPQVIVVPNPNGNGTTTVIVPPNRPPERQPPVRNEDPPATTTSTTTTTQPCRVGLAGVCI